MRRVWVMLAVLGLGCSVQLTGAPCTDDLQCPKQLHCGLTAECVDGPRTEAMLGESCRLAVHTVAERVDECLGIDTESAFTILGPEEVCRSVETSVAAGRLDFRPEEFGTCLRRLRKAECGDLDLTRLALGTMLDNCPAFAPQVAPGGECGNSADCQDGWCSITNTCPGVCRAFIPHSGSCSDADRCLKGSICSGQVCRRYALAGDSCEGFVKCDPNSNSYCLNNRCVARKTSGSCADNSECALKYSCVKTQPAQEDSPKECRLVKGLNEPCADPWECPGFSYCDSGTGTCRPWREQGASCGEFDGKNWVVGCLAGHCEGLFPSLCRDPIPLGNLCAYGLECGPSADCRNSHCAPVWCQ